MPRKRSISPTDAGEWLALLLDHSFSLRRVTAPARLDLLGIAHDATAYPDDIPPARLAELLLRWAERYVNAADWQRLQARIRKRRSR